MLATFAVASFGVSTFFALRLLASHCEGFGCTYLGVAWLFWLGVLFLPASLLGYFAQRSSAFSVRARHALRVAWAAHGLLGLGLLAWWAFN